MPFSGEHSPVLKGVALQQEASLNRSVSLCKLTNKVEQLCEWKGVLAIRRIFSLVDMITKPKFSNCPNIFKIELFR